MARGAAGKLRRRNLRKEMGDEDIFSSEGGKSDFDTPEEEINVDDIPLPPKLQQQVDAEEEEEEAAAGDKKKKKRGGGVSDEELPANTRSSKGGIKTMPLILLVLMTGTTLMPAVIYAGDFLGNFFQNSHIFGRIGYQLGIGPSPKKRIYSFYEKHDPAKVNNIPKIMAEHYGDYPKLIKRLERKYQDYGYFIDWEKDDAPMKLATEQLADTRDHLLRQWTAYAPDILKTGARNMKYNLTYLFKRGRKLWKRRVWPLLEPIFGVPEGAEQQKRRDAREARDRKAQGPRKKRNTEFRDEE